MPDIDASARCPCGTGLRYGECCRPFLEADAQPPTAERMMRSRYTAYALRHPGYLLATWHPSTRPAKLTLDPGLTWISLDILGRTRGGMLDSVGTVDFRATYRSEGMRMYQQENSSFVRENKTWFYVDGVVSI
ncbi:MAG TPA: YchJ family metal-binding protein [Galbitalea sp.]